MTRWSAGRMYGRPREPRAAAQPPTSHADAVTTDRLPAAPPVVGADPARLRHTRSGDNGPRPRTAPMQVLPGQGGGRGPDRWTRRAGELLDQHVLRVITRDQLLHRLSRDVWSTTWDPALQRAAFHHGTVTLAADLPHLRERAAWYARVEADVDRCPQCRPHQTCPMHLRQLRTYWDDLHAVAARIAHPPRPPQRTLTP